MKAHTKQAAHDVEPARAKADISDLVVEAPRAAPDELAGGVRQRLYGVRHGTVTHIALEKDGTFAGLVRATDLMAAPDADRVGDHAMSDPPVVTLGASRDEAAFEATRRGESEVAVVAEDGSLHGIIPAPRMLAMLVREHDDDLARLGGFLHQGDSAREASNEPLARRLAHRTPWLIVGLVGALFTSVMMGTYEEELSSVVALAFFVPAIVYLANAVGSQTFSIVVRGLSVGISIRSVALRELATGLLLGLIVGSLFVLPAYWLVHDWNVAMATGVALVIACGAANFVSLGAPWLFAKLGMDPAFGTGPLATVIQDVTSIAIYFAVASVMVPM